MHATWAVGPATASLAAKLTRVSETEVCVRLTTDATHLLQLQTHGQVASVRLKSDATHLLHLQMLSRRHLKLGDLGLDLIHLGPAFASNEQSLVYVIICYPCNEHEASNCSNLACNYMHAAD